MSAATAALVARAAPGMAATAADPRPTARADQAPAIVRLIEVTRRFGDAVALDRVSIEVLQGEVLGIIGRSGAGKSTLIRCLNGLERPDSGSITVEGREITTLDETELQPIRRRVGMIFQHFNLLAQKTVARNVDLPLKIEGRPRHERAARVAKLLELTGLAGKAGAYPAQLSGGQKQRVGIARALAARPALLLSDEATSVLDPETTASILQLFKDINSRYRLTILLITHEMDVIRRVADRVVVLDHGRIVEQGPVRHVLTAPRSETTRSLLSALRPELPPEIAALLRPAGGEEALLRVDLAGDQARGPLIADLTAATGLRARLIHGGIDRVQGEPVARLFLAVPAGDPAPLRAALEHLRPRVSAVEVAGYVTADA